MIVLRDTASMQAAMDSAVHPTLKTLIQKRIDQLLPYIEADLSELVNFVIVEPGTGPAAVEEALGFSIFTNPIDGTSFGEPGFSPTFEAIVDHGSHFELIYVQSDDGFGTILYVEDHPGVEFDLHMFCLEYSGRCC